jgi:type IV pilus assembly protein PilO
MKKMTLNNIYEWPLMTRLLLLGLVCSAAFYFGYRYDLTKQMKSLSQAKQQEVDIKQQIELIIAKNLAIKNEVARLPELRSELVKWKKEVVTYNDLPELLNNILKLGGDNHLFFSLFAPGASVKVALPDPVKDIVADSSSAAAVPAAPAPTDPAAVEPPKKYLFAKVPIKVVLVGNYHQIADFISQIANMPSLIVVGNFTITNEASSAVLGEKLAQQAEAQHLLSAELTLDVYHALENK